MDENKLCDFLEDVIKQENWQAGSCVDSLDADSIKWDSLNLDALNPNALAYLYVKSSYLVSSLEYIAGQLRKPSNAPNHSSSNAYFAELISPMFLDEIASLAFLKESIIQAGPTELKRIGKRAAQLAQHVITLICNGPAIDRKAFAAEALKKMTDVFLREENLQIGRSEGEGHHGPCLYRSFDSLDQVLNIRYEHEQTSLQAKQSKERLYLGSGVGVQSGYSTILLALHHLDLNSGDKVIDLGSGFGRVGLVFCLLRPDIYCTGYEYMPGRVEAANDSARIFHLEEKLSYKTQDLSNAPFKVPDAEVYYLYDPFTKETYEKILQQLILISRRKKITIVTKGNARNQLVDLSSQHNWPKAIFLDESNLCLFASE